MLDRHRRRLLKLPSLSPATFSSTPHFHYQLIQPLRQPSNSYFSIITKPIMAREPASLTANLRRMGEERTAAVRQNNGKEAVRNTNLPTGARRDQETPGMFMAPTPVSRRESIQPGMETIN